MEIGIIKDPKTLQEYAGHLESAIALAKAMMQEPENSGSAPMIDIVVMKLEKIAQGAKLGKALDEIAGLTSFAGDIPIGHSKLAMAVWQAEEYFSEKVLRELMREMGMK